MFLEIATTIGAISGAFLAGVLAPNLLNIIFGVILLVSARRWWPTSERTRREESPMIAWPAGCILTAPIPISNWQRGGVSGDAHALGTGHDVRRRPDLGTAGHRERNL